MIPLWKGKNPIYFGVITIIPFDKLYRRAYFVMHTFLVKSILHSNRRTITGDVILKPRNYTSCYEEYCTEIPEW